MTILDSQGRQPPPPYTSEGYSSTQFDGRHAQAAQHSSETTTLLVIPNTQKGCRGCRLWKFAMTFTLIVVIFGGYIFRLNVYRGVTSARQDVQREKDKWNNKLMLARKELQNEKEEWDSELVLARRKLRNERVQWNRELMRERGKWELEERDWKARQAEEHRREEQWHREEEERERLGLFWDEPKPENNCLVSGTREYWSLLRNVVPYNYNWLKPCMEIPAIIRGVSRTVDRCEIKMDGSGAVYGHWIVEDAECTPYWTQFKDLGCTSPGSGIHRYEAHLEDIPDGEYWKHICATTPYDFLGHHFDHPHSCMHWGKYGVYANWEVEDWNC